MIESRIYSPDSWELVKVTTNSKVHYRILAGWSGSYMYGNSYKLSSGFDSADQVVNLPYNWKIPQSSGSVYILSKNSEKPSVATVGVLKSVMQQNTNVVLEVISMKDFVQNLI